MKIKNLTPHPVSVLLANGEVITYPSEGLARVGVQPRTPYTVDGLPVPVLPAPVWGAVEGLPPPAAGVAYIVSLLVLSALKESGRTDVFAPATGPGEGALRNKEGQITAVSQFVAV